MGESDPSRKYVHLTTGGVMEHQKKIMAIKEQIKPGMISIAFKPYTLDMLLIYFHALILSSAIHSKNKINYLDRKKSLSSMSLNNIISEHQI
jgi:hypothetical protein